MVMAHIVMAHIVMAHVVMARGRYLEEPTMKRLLDGYAKCHEWLLEGNGRWVSIGAFIILGGMK